MRPAQKRNVQKSGYSLIKYSIIITAYGFNNRNNKQCQILLILTTRGGYCRAFMRKANLAHMEKYFERRVTTLPPHRQHFLVGFLGIAASL